MSVATVESAIGRLRQAEQAIDIVRLDVALREAKDAVDTAIHTEMLAATRAWILFGGRPSLTVTRPMVEPLEQLHELGRQEAWNELDRLGYQLRRFEEIEPSPNGDVDGYLRRNLTAVEVRIEQNLVRADLSGLAVDAIARALLRVPGGRDIASRIVSTALIGGLAQTFEEVADEIGCWEYTSVLDGGTCEICRLLDGTRYETLPELFLVLPGFGPNPRCLGGGRCRCRAVPCHADEAPSPAQPEPQPFRTGFRSELGRELSSDVEPTWQALDALLILPRDRGPDDGLPVGQEHTLPYEIHGRFQYRAGGEAVRIDINPGRFNSAITLAHEIGHYLDYAFLGDSETRYATRIAPELDGWRQAVINSAARQQLLAIQNAEQSTASLRAHTSYLLEAKEVFARSFAQWLALRSGDPELLRQIDEERGDPATAEEVYVPLYWMWDDFEPIAAAFDELFATSGMLLPEPGA